MSYGDDWAEKYRPELISDLEGNEDKINKIRKWLESWYDGRIPKITANKTYIIALGPSDFLVILIYFNNSLLIKILSRVFISRK